jgi:hypothetical protein
LFRRGRNGIAVREKPMSKLDPSKVDDVVSLRERIEGDDCLMELARRRFQQAGMGTEFHADTPENLERMMKFRPSRLPRYRAPAPELSPD